MKIIADGAIKETLKSLLQGGGPHTHADGGDAVGGAAVANGDAVVVYANTADSTRRASAGGLKSLDELLADPRQRIGALLVVSFETRESLLERAGQCPGALLLEPFKEVAFQRLPAGRGELASLLRSETPSRVWAQGDWRGPLLRLEASSRILSSDSARYRHDHKNLIAAVRIFLGALHAGHVAADDAHGLLSELARLEAEGGGAAALALDAELLIEQCRRHGQFVEEVGRARPPLSSRYEGPWKPRLVWFEETRRMRGKAHAVPRDCRVLMLDDKYDRLGWRLVLDAVIGGPGRVAYARDWESARGMLDDDVDVMLLDCNLGCGQSTGLELLAPIRAVRAGLPVVMMTAYDNAELALWSLRAGCNDFYAKELKDRADRDSFDYYRRFAEILTRGDWQWRKSLRRLWRNFESRLPIPPSWQDDEAHVRYAFYLLFSLADNTMWWARGGVLPFAEGETLREWICRAAVLAVIPSPRIHLTARAAEIAIRARHPGSKVTYEESLFVLKEAVNSLPERKRRLAERERVAARMPDGCRLSREMLVQDEELQYEAGDEASLSIGHLERSRLGALQFALGRMGATPEAAGEFGRLFRGAPHEASRAFDEIMARRAGEIERVTLAGDITVVLIDDEGDVNGWHRALSSSLTNSVEWYASVEDFLKAASPVADKKCVVLLDLWLLDPATGRPSPEAGLEALRLLKEADFALPVIVLSAATDTVNAIRCMKQGALDYVPKWLPKEEGVEHWNAFATALLNRVRTAAALGGVGPGTLRGLWRSFASVLTADSDLNRAPELLERVKNWPWGGRTHDERLARVRGEFYGLLLPAIVLFHGNRVSLVTNGEIPPLDAWRIKRVLQTRLAVDEDITLFAGRAVELLGQVRCAIENPDTFSMKKYLKGERGGFGSYTKWVEDASMPAGEVWEARNLVKRKSNRPAKPPDAAEVLTKAVGAVAQFERDAASLRYFRPRNLRA